MSGAGTTETIANAVASALLPLEAQLSADNIIPFLAELGLQLPPQLTSQASFMNAAAQCASAASALSTTLAQFGTDLANKNTSGIITDGLQLISGIGAIVSGLEQVGTELASISGSLPGINAAELATFAQNLAPNLLSYLLIDYAQSQQSGALGIATALGLVSYLPKPGVAGDPSHPPYIERKLQLSNLGGLLSSPGNLFKTLFGWGSPGFDGSVFTPVIQSATTLLGAFPARDVEPGPPNSLALNLLSISPDPTTSPPGYKAALNYALPGTYNVTLPLDDTWSVQLQVQGSFAAGLSASIIPPTQIALHPPTGTLSGTLQMQLTAQGASADDPLMIFGQTGGSRVQTDSFGFGAGIAVQWDATTSSASADPQLTLQIKGGKVVIDMSNADGFLAAILSGINVEGGFDLAATWQLDTGLHITGGAQLEIDLPLNIELGPVSLQTLYLVGGIASDAITLEVSVALGVTLGPISATVDRVGALGTLTFPSHGANLGFANLAIGFKPPDGLGLDIDAGPASGGGYISFDPGKGEYAGVLDVSLVDIVQVKVIGVIDTIMPDGSSGFSFILIITFDFPPIELGFGFTLNGVGGLGGVNRTINTTALQAGFVAHSLDSILFPPDPIANAPAIISNIRNFFPVAKDSYIFGPMVELGWGEPTLITLEIGVILELPDPVIIVLLGLVDVALPTADAPLIQLHIDILGELDFGTKTLELEGDLYDSSVLIYATAGSLYFSIAWGSDPNFVYSVGGFNPHFNTAGLNLPPMQRCSVSIGAGDNPRISANNYFAVTSNSLQFGANVQAYASAAGFTIQGYLGFDVLVIFSPFSFEFDFSASFSASFEGVNLCALSVSGSFSGPRPWNLNGSASISILCWSVSASLNITWGDSTPVTVPQKPVLPDLVSALQAPGNWSAALPAGTTPAVSLAAPAPGTPTILVHPMGTLSVRENVVPLDVAVSKYGNATPSDGTLFAISDVRVNGQEAIRQPLQEYFAPGQFNALDDADKLASPSFELYDAGATLGASAVQSGEDSPRTMVYQEFYIDTPASLSRRTGPYLMRADIYDALARQGAGFSSPLARSGLGKYSAGRALGAIRTADQGYVIASTSDLSVRSDLASTSGVTYFQARAALDAHLAASPADAGTLQIVTVYEAAA